MESLDETSTAAAYPSSEISNELRLEKAFYREFFEQAPALECSKREGYLPIFAEDKMDSANEGAKSYIVASYDSMWDEYRRTEPEERRWYEILIDSLPCRLLHIDAEFYTEFNPDIGDVGIMDADFRNYCREFVVSLGYAEAISDVKITVLDSSNSEKFSKHYLIDVKGKLFENNFHCGAFSRRLVEYVSRMEEEREEDEGGSRGTGSRNRFLVRDKDGKSTPLCDLSIYTRYRNFRIVGCTKRRGGFRPLKKEEEEEETEGGGGTGRDVSKKDFLDSLIQYVPPGSERRTVVECRESDGTEPESGQNKRKRRGGERRDREKRTETSARSGDTTSTEDPFASLSGRSTVIPAVAYGIASYVATEWEKTCALVGGAYFSAVIPKYYDGEKRRIRFETDSKTCVRKYRATGQSEHGGNHAHFTCDLDTKMVYQGCYSEKYDCGSILPRRMGGDDGPSDAFYIEDEALQQEIDRFFGEFEPKEIFKKAFLTLDAAMIHPTPHGEGRVAP